MTKLTILALLFITSCTEVSKETYFKSQLSLTEEEAKWTLDLAKYSYPLLDLQKMKFVTGNLGVRSSLGTMQKDGSMHSKYTKTRHDTTVQVAIRIDNYQHQPSISVKYNREIQKGNVIYQMLISNNDTIYITELNKATKQVNYLRGRYYFIYHQDTTINRRQRAYYFHHRDSLNRVKGNDVLPIPEADDKLVESYNIAHQAHYSN